VGGESLFSKKFCPQPGKKGRKGPSPALVRPQGRFSPAGRKESRLVGKKRKATRPRIKKKKPKRGEAPRGAGLREKKEKSRFHADHAKSALRQTKRKKEGGTEDRFSFSGKGKRKESRTLPRSGRLGGKKERGVERGRCGRLGGEKGAEACRPSPPGKKKKKKGACSSSKHKTYHFARHGGGKRGKRGETFMRRTRPVRWRKKKKGGPNLLVEEDQLNLDD